MKLGDLTLDMLHTAIDRFVEIAYEGETPPSPPVKPSGRTVEEALEAYRDGSPDSTACRRFVIRLGCKRYPFMKLALEEYLLEDQYFFIVDTHDQMELKPGMPDYEAWNELKRSNRETKEAIEARWAEEGLPTLADLARVTAEVAVGDPVSVARRILVVDDEVPLARSLSDLLERKGYSVTTTYDGRHALDEIERGRPDLVVMDYEMPRLDGIELCTLLRGDPSTRDIPVLLATTASTIDLEQVMRLANGFLVKPYQKEILFDCIRHLVP